MFKGRSVINRHNGPSSYFLYVGTGHCGVNLSVFLQPAQQNHFKPFFPISQRNTTLTLSHGPWPGTCYIISQLGLKPCWQDLRLAGPWSPKGQGLSAYRIAVKRLSLS